MAPANTLFKAARPVLRQQAFAGAQVRNAFRTSQFRAQFRESSKRWQSSSAGAAEGAAQVSWFKRMWDSPVGLKTVHFWAPVMKLDMRFWSTQSACLRETSQSRRTSACAPGILRAGWIANLDIQWALVLAGIADLARPAEKLSLTQNGALTATGIIWTRWCLIIKPKNYLLAAVNFFLGVVGVVQCTRIFMWQASQKKTVGDVAVEVKDKVKEAASS
ncbi:hypothetical protein CPLU01_12245 [Colletotrichum plurivorum]|uniref:Mitochondrial pyruvate carrier n=1 Tax=Colletotrichum plurivorum TaxID=2175906 RepID=A0A8H6N798_9PEZI|nr:hypothetical protein CPLU01_12245 [Colletotrichum plurivorum]